MLVQTSKVVLHNVASTNALSQHCRAFTYNSLHKAKRTHRGRNYQKGFVAES